MKSLDLKSNELTKPEQYKSIDVLKINERDTMLFLKTLKGNGLL